MDRLRKQFATRSATDHENRGMAGMGEKYVTVSLKKFGGGCAPSNEARSQIWWLRKEEPTKPVGLLLQGRPRHPEGPEDLVESRRCAPAALLTIYSHT